MTAAATIPWRCLDCPESGLTTGGDRGADAKHVAATQHGTTSGLRNIEEVERDG